MACEHKRATQKWQAMQNRSEMWNRVAPNAERATGDCLGPRLQPAVPGECVAAHAAVPSAVTIVHAVETYLRANLEPLLRKVVQDVLQQQQQQQQQQQLQPAAQAAPEEDHESEDDAEESVPQVTLAQEIDYQLGEMQQQMLYRIMGTPGDMRLQFADEEMVGLVNRHKDQLEPEQLTTLLDRLNAYRCERRVWCEVRASDKAQPSAGLRPAPPSATQTAPASTPTATVQPQARLPGSHPLHILQVCGVQPFDFAYRTSATNRIHSLLRDHLHVAASLLATAVWRVESTHHPLTGTEMWRSRVKYRAFKGPWSPWVESVVDAKEQASLLCLHDAQRSPKWRRLFLKPFPSPE
jgi:hypothetical protein